MGQNRVPDGPHVPLWAQVYARGELALTTEDRAWMRARPPAVQVLMLRFPPHAIVRCGPLDVRAVRGYHPTGWLRCCDGLDVPRDRWSWARADAAELVLCWRSLTPDVVRTILAGP